jgi:dihydrofolate synthase / folylpolyglutamate synthase
MTNDQTLTEINTILDRFTHFGVELGLERIERLLAALGNPERQVPIVHVAGSNGKGSVCAYLSAVLHQAGYRVGRYTSPHLVSWCERICLNQQEIPARELHQILRQVLDAIDPDKPSPTQFEVITAAAWLYFAQQKVDIAVIEVGLGGRLDATNVCDRPLISIITSLSREHWQRLGPTLADISREKAGILKQSCPAVIAPQPPEAATVLKQRLTELNCPAIWVQPSRDLGNGWAEFVGAGSSDGLHYPLRLLGAHQLINSALAIAALRILQQQGWQITDEQIVQGMAKTQWQGRLQWMNWQGYKLLVDGAHNPAGAEMLRDYLDRTQAEPMHFVMGMIANKDHADVFKALLRPGDWLHLVPVPDHLPVDLSELKTVATTVCPTLAACEIHADVLKALEVAAVQAQTTGGTLILCGSLYLIGHFFQLLKGE